VSAGLFNTLFTFEQAPVIRTSTNQPKLDWAHATSVGNRYGRFLPQDGKEFAAASQLFASADWVIECYGRIELTTAMRIRQGARQFDILSIRSTDGKAYQHADKLRIVCKERAVD
jgi:head-tail adaptor